MTVRSNPTVRRRRLGSELRRLRTSARLRIDQVARQLEFSESKVSRIETGHVAASPRDVADLLNLYRVSGEQREELIQLARDARKKGWWHAFGRVPRSAYIGFEAAAEQILTYETTLVPGLLQTPAYARTVITATHPDLPEEDVEQRVQLRKVRQSHLVQDDPPTVRAVLDEAALRRPIGGQQTMKDQIARLVEASALPTVQIQVLPFRVGEHMGLYGPFTILTFREPDQPTVVYLEKATSESFLEADDDIRQYELTFDQLCAKALEPDDSVGFLVDLGKTL